MEQELRSTFLLANVAYRHRSSFLRCKQGKRSLQDYVMELHNLEAAMAGAPLSEDVKVTVFMDGVRTGPVRTELFRRQPKTFNEAVHIAMLEDHCVRSAQGHAPHVEASEGPTPMEISLAESARSQKTQRASGRCFGCNQPDHFRRNCPTNPWKGATRQEVRSASGSQQPRGDRVGKRRLPVGAGTPCWETSLLVEEGESLTSLSKGTSPWDDTSVSLRGRRAV
ncbi:hypothetical protein PF003_g9505 [Phytophthora fragariae]|nr:hypothetical protein PF003_g9505 [Phytophthora fragariae]